MSVKTGSKPGLKTGAKTGVKTRSTAIVLLCAALTFGCTTTGYFELPPGSEIEIYERPAVTPDSSGMIEMKPFFWTAAGGVPYKLKKNGEVVKEGRLPARFRVVSIFWPPLALIYWPIGFNSDQTNDLTQ